ncbi:MAG: thioesterase family protein [bacterium]|nr:thioesterase family protein [bacterium]
MFTSASKVRLHQTDAAGVLFFGDYFRIAHDAYEEFLESIEYNIRFVIEEANTLLLIVHAESDYRRPLRVGEQIETNIVVDKIGGSSFILRYEIRDTSQTRIADLTTVHVAADRCSGKKQSIPKELVEKLRPHLKEKA